jgi:hypothetical protein
MCKGWLSFEFYWETVKINDIHVLEQIRIPLALSLFMRTNFHQKLTPIKNVCKSTPVILLRRDFFYTLFNALEF